METTDENIEIIEITNSDFFNMIDNQVRTKFADFEAVEILKKAHIVLEKSNIKPEELKDYPVEGYYYKSKKLTEYFKIIRNFQENDDIFDRVDVECEEFKYIKYITDRELFGKKESTRREDSGASPSILPRRFDIIAMAMRDNDLFDDSIQRPWDMESIIKNLEKKFTNTPNLVELAYLTKDKACLVCAAETNSLYRDYVYFSGCSFDGRRKYYVWKVDKDVEDLGVRTIAEYNDIIPYDGMKLKVPTLENHEHLDKTTEKPRLARLGLVGDTWYYWILNKDGSVVEEYTTEEKTTETETEKESSIF